MVHKAAIIALSRSWDNIWKHRKNMTPKRRTTYVKSSFYQPFINEPVLAVTVSARL